MISPRSETVLGASTVESNDLVLNELRRMNRLLAMFTTRGMPRPDAISFLAASGFSSVQIGEILGVNPVTVRTALHRARKASDSATSSTKNEEPANLAEAIKGG